MISWINYSDKIQGLSHIRKSVPCQDSYSYYARDGIIAIALSDGMSSARYSHIGSNKIVTFVARYLVDNYSSIFHSNNTNKTFGKMLQELKDSLQLEANKIKCDLKDFNSTLMFVLVSKKYAILGKIGDGSIGFTKRTKSYVVFDEEKNDAVNMTTSCLSANPNFQVGKIPVQKIQSFLLMSDGTADTLENREAPRLCFKGYVTDTLIPKLITNDNAQEEIKDLLLKIRDYNTNDDCSINILVKRNVQSKYISTSKNERMDMIKKYVSRVSVIQRYNIYLSKIINLTTRTPASLSYLLKHMKLSEYALLKFLRILKQEGYIYQDEMHLWKAR